MITKDLTLLDKVIESLEKPRTFNEIVALCGTSGEPVTYSRTRMRVMDALDHLWNIDLLEQKDNQDYNGFIYSLKPVNALEVLQRDFPLNYQLATAPKPTTLYNWSNAPEWANYAAKDENGVCYMHQYMPYISELFNGEWLSRGMSENIGYAQNYCTDWRSSLEKRPEAK